MPSVRHAMEQGGQAVSSGSISRMLKVAFWDQNNHTGRKKKLAEIHNDNKKHPKQTRKTLKKKQNLHFQE